MYKYNMACLILILLIVTAFLNYIDKKYLIPIA